MITLCGKTMECIVGKTVTQILRLIFFQMDLSTFFFFFFAETISVSVNERDIGAF